LGPTRRRFGLGREQEIRRRQRPKIGKHRSKIPLYPPLGKGEGFLVFHGCPPL
jgi:hypothetical protein